MADGSDEVHVVYLRRVHLDHLANLAEHMVALIDESHRLDGGMPAHVVQHRSEVLGALARLHAAQARGPRHR